jgi:ketosteroid isomerase-like protein
VNPGVSVESKLESIRAIFDSFAAFDAEGVAERMTQDVLLRPSAFITGRSEYRGREDVYLGFRELEEQLARTGSTVKITPVRHYRERDDEEVLMSLARIEIIRESGQMFGTDIAYRFTMEGDMVSVVEAWLDHEEGLAKLEDPVELGR